MPRLAAAVIGCGDVAVNRYLPYLAGQGSFVENVSCADVDADRARRTAERFGLSACTPEAALADPGIDMVVNLTLPLAHNRKSWLAHIHIKEEIVEEARGIGVEELALSILQGEPSRLEGDFPLHVLESMEAIVTAARTGIAQRVSSRTERPAPYDPWENPRNRIGS